MNYAEDVNYWKSSQSSSDTWLDKAKKEIRRVGGLILSSGFAEEEVTGRSAFMLTFDLEQDRYKIIYPVLQSKSGNQKAAKIQAATALYHQVKASCVALKFVNARGAFGGHLVLPSGKTVAEVDNEMLSEMLPEMVRPALVAGEVVVE